MGLTVGPNSDQVLLDIVQAIAHAQRKHGPLSVDPVRACAIMLREGGEAMNEALLMTVPGVAVSRHARGLLYAELAQVAATAALIMQNLRGEGI